MKKYVMDCRREVAATRKMVAELYKANVLGSADVRVTFPTCIAYALERYAKAREKGRIDFAFYRDAPASAFGVTAETLECPDIRYRTSFNASESLIARIDAVKVEAQAALSGGGKINRNWIVATIFRVAIHEAADTVHYLEESE